MRRHGGPVVLCQRLARRLVLVVKGLEDWAACNPGKRKPLYEPKDCAEPSVKFVPVHSNAVPLPLVLLRTVLPVPVKDTQINKGVWPAFGYTANQTNTGRDPPQPKVDPRREFVRIPEMFRRHQNVLHGRAKIGDIRSPGHHAYRHEQHGPKQYLPSLTVALFKKVRVVHLRQVSHEIEGGTFFVPVVSLVFVDEPSNCRVLRRAIRNAVLLIHGGVSANINANCSPAKPAVPHVVDPQLNETRSRGLPQGKIGTHIKNEEVNY